LPKGRVGYRRRDVSAKHHLPPNSAIFISIISNVSNASNISNTSNAPIIPKY
jgi:hypothetical protein